jgi:hypothetical protein
LAETRLDPGRQQFVERILAQLRSRYPSWEFREHEQGFGVTALKDHARVAISLTTLHQAVQREGAVVPQEILRFVQAVAPRLSSAEAGEGGLADAPQPDTIVWCVRTRKVINRYPRAQELLTREMAAGLTAFVAEALPGEIMRGVSRDEAARGGLSPEALLEAADRNTAVRLQGWRELLAAPPTHGRWLFTQDSLFSSSLLLVPEFLQAAAARGRGSALLLAPDRGVVVVGLDEGENAPQMRHIGRRLYGRATSPLSPQLLASDGQSVFLHPSETVPRRPWAGWRQVLGLRER